MSLTRSTKLIPVIVSIFMLSLAMSGVALGASIALQNATATFSQALGDWPVGETIDGSFAASNGWAIFDSGTTSSQTAVWETASDLNASSIQFDLYMLAGDHHTLGRFRFSVTSDDRNTFADGAASGGDVTANWIVLTNAAVTGPAGMTFTILPDDSILAGGVDAIIGVYTVAYNSIPISNITGFRLEVIEDPSLPSSGPGRHPTNGNFVLTELEASAVPEPATLLLLGSGLLVGAAFRKRLK